MLETSADQGVGGDDPLRVGAVVGGRYHLRRVLGRGAAAVVFAAEHALVRRPVAIKLPLRVPDLHELLCARLRREIAALAHIRHACVVDAIDAGENDGLPFLAMQLLDGRTLSGLIAARGALRPDETIKVGLELAAGLRAVHAAQFVHRDVKPSNVLITSAPDNQVHLCDLGIARALGPIPAFEHKLTQSGCPLGTPEYMSIEALCADEAVDHRVDVYALGITLFECLTGRVPVEGSVGEIMHRLHAGPIPPVTALRPDVPLALAEVITRCTALDVRARFASMDEVASALHELSRKPVASIDLLRALPSRSASAGATARQPEARRGHVRAPYVTMASLQRDGGPLTPARTEDISEGGVLLISEVPYATSEVIAVRLALPISGKVAALRATVRWVRSSRGAPATGVEFMELPASARHEIKRYVELMGKPR